MMGGPVWRRSSDWLEHTVHTRGVTGSIPVVATNLKSS